MKVILTLILVGFVIFCGLLITAETSVFEKHPSAADRCILLQKPANTQQFSAANEPAKTVAEPIQPLSLTADHAEAKIITLGSLDRRTGFKFQLQLTTKGAAIENAVFSEFDDRDYKNPQPLVILSPIADGIVSMANREFVLIEQKMQLALDKLHWKSSFIEKDPNGAQTIRFEAVIKDKTKDEPVIKLVKTYKITPDSYLIDCNLSVENLSATSQNVQFNLTGPAGLGREAVRADMRKAVAVFENPGKGRLTDTRIDIKKFNGKKTFDEKNLIKNSDRFLWAAATSKYFAAILVPLPDEGQKFCSWIREKTARFYNPDGLKQSGDENIAINFKTTPQKLAGAAEAESTRHFNFLLYVGPKDKRIFSKNSLYRRLGFIHTIDFLACCCPAAIIQPLAFGILAIMEWLYRFIPNYGVVIIILVFLIRFAIHPLTKKSQVSMSKMQKLAPQIEQIKKKYAGNKTELNKQIMALYKEQGASPITGMLPMFVQMPIWIALYSAIYASISLRGAAFLSVWITDLSAPDALFRFSPVTVPLFGWKIDSFNLLPLLMGLAFYFQQKLMPKTAAAQTSPQMAQQQKMMMIMMPIMFPLLLYKAPSGLNLYIMASTFAGVIEQYVIRKHIREKEQAEASGLVAVTSKTGGKVKKKKPKPFFKNM